MIDVVITVVLALVTICFTYMGIYLALHPAGSAQATKRYNYAFGLLALVAVALIVWQGYRTNKYQERQEKKIESLKQDIRERDDKLAEINRQQLQIVQKELDLKYKPSVDVVYDNKRLKIYNRGKTNLSFWGTKVSKGPKTIEIEPRIISPSPNSFYYVLIDEFEKEVRAKLPSNGEIYIPLELFITNERSQKYIVKCLLYFVVANGEVSIHTQNTGILRSDWSKKE